MPGYLAAIPFREGIRRTVEWFDADPARIRIDTTNNQLMDHLLTAYGCDK